MDLNNKDENNNLNFNLEAVPVKVSKIHFDGLSRTKNDFVAAAVGSVFHANTLGQLLVRVGEAQDKLRQLEIFKEVAVMIDVDKSVHDYKSSDGYDITFIVKELGRVAASAKTEMGAQADAQVKAGVRMPNIFGRGERLELEYAYSSIKEENTQISFTKPFPRLLDSSLKTTFFNSTLPNLHAGYLMNSVGTLVTYFCSVKTPNLPSIHHKLEYEAAMRQLSPSNIATPFSIRTLCGYSFKSAFRHIMTVDTRDRQMFAKHGFFVNFLQEYSGLFGDVKYHKFDLDFQHNLTLPLDMTIQSSFRTGVLTPLDRNPLSHGISDRFFMGGPYTLRGFELKGVGVESGGVSLGGLAYWSTAAHLYMPLFYLNRKFPMVENCRLHFFINGGNLAQRLLGGNFMKDIRAAYGFGLAVAFGNFGRFELNYCIPFKHSARDKAVHGLQFGVGVHFL